MYQFGPTKAHPLIKGLVICMITSSLLWSLSAKFFPYFTAHYLKYLFTLSVSGISKGFIWQFVTYFFAQPFSGISLFSLIDLAFKGYLLYVFGHSLIESKGTKSFLKLVISSTIFTGLLVLTLLYGFRSPFVFMGSNATIFSLLTAWMILNPHAKLYIFFAIPINVVYLITGFWILNLLINLSDGNFIDFTAYLASGLFGYFYAVAFFKHQSPFSFLHPFESRFLHRKKKEKNRRFRPSKIFDFKTGKPVLDDEIFMDQMLEKINLYGEDSLTKEEKKRMEKISRRFDPS